MKILKAFPAWLIPPVVLSLASVLVYIGRVLATDRLYLGFMNWNLFLAWLPLGLAWLLSRSLKQQRWLSWQPLLLTVLWLLFLPNSFYMVTDFIHLAPDEDISMLYDIVLILGYALSGLLLGSMSIYLVHAELKKRADRRTLYGLMGVAFLLSSFAIYLGRYLGHNSWDVLTNPFGIMLDMVDGLTNPGEHAGMFTTTLLFFVFTSVVYAGYYFTRGRLKSNR